MTLQTPRSVDQTHAGLLALRPDGWASSKLPDDYLGTGLRPAAHEFVRIEQSMFAMLPETDPRSAPHLLADWERMLGPDPCQVSAQITDTGVRGAIAYQRLTGRGDICAGYFVAYAAAIGETITIQEFAASECGVSVCGDTLNPSPGHMSFLVTLPATDVVDAICGETVCGEPLGSFRGSVMECVIRNGAPLFATPYFLYTS